MIYIGNCETPDFQNQNNTNMEESEVKQQNKRQQTDVALGAISLVDSENEKVVELSKDKELHIEKDEETKEDTGQQDFIPEESLRIQQAQWVKQQVLKQREIEDETRRLLEEEQRILDEMRRSTKEYMDRTKELHKYNEDCKEQMREQVYALNGLSDDKLFGIQQYKNAYYRGIFLAAFLLSMALTAFCGYLEGLDSELTLFMLAFTAIQGALYSQDEKRSMLAKGICRFFNLLMLPAMIVMFVCYELELFVPDILLSALTLAGGIVLFVAALGYFIENPYRGIRKQIRNAEGDLKEIEQQAEKAIKKNTKLRKKRETRLARLQKKEEAHLERVKQREEARLARAQRREEKRLARIGQRQEIELARLAQRESARQMRLQKQEEMKNALLEKREEIKSKWQSEKPETEPVLNVEKVEADKEKEEKQQAADKDTNIKDAAEVVPIQKS